MLDPENITSDPFATELDDFLSSTNGSLTNYSTIESSDGGTQLAQLNVPYAVMEILVAVVAVIGNALVIIVFYRERRLRRRTNYYIVSLALADFLVGLLGIPFAILVRSINGIKLSDFDGTLTMSRRSLKLNSWPSPTISNYDDETLFAFFFTRDTI